jgi:hypothetical protein
MSKDNVENNFNNPSKISNQKKEKKESKKKHLQANGFKGLEKTFTNNGV